MATIGKRTRLLTGSAAASATVMIPAEQVADYSSFSVQITSVAAATSTIVVEISNDNTNWVATRTQNAQDATVIAGAIPADVIGVIFRGPIIARFIRVRCLVYAAAGTVGASLFLTPDVFASVVKSA